MQITKYDLLLYSITDDLTQQLEKYYESSEIFKPRLLLFKYNEYY